MHPIRTLVLLALGFMSGCGSEPQPPELTGRLAFITTRTREIREQSVIGIWEKGGMEFFKLPDAGSAKWSPDGKIFVNNIMEDLIFMDEYGNIIKSLPTLPDLEIYDFEWFPDGKRLLVVDQPRGFAKTKGKGKQNLCIYNIETAEREVLKTGSEDHDYFNGIDVSPSGQEILYSKNQGPNRSEKQKWPITLMRLGDKEIKELFNGEQPTWSPNGQSFAFIHGVYNKKGEVVSMTEISIYDLETGKRRQITDGTGLWILDLAFNPDGHSIIFDASTGEVNRLFHISVKGGKIVKLFEDGTTFADKPVSDSAPDWTA